MENTSAATPEPADDAHGHPPFSPYFSWSVILLAGIAIWFLGPRWQQDTVGPQGWKLLAVFVPTILALMLRPIPGGAAVLLGVTATALLGALPLKDALAGYQSPTVWLVLAAFFMSRAFLKTGLARRIALTFIRLMGRNTLGLSYSLVFSDAVLAGMIPSNAARVGGVLLPITRSLAELYDSFPGRTAGRLGSFLMLGLYQADVVACAMFFTGQASNPLIAEIASDVTGGKVQITYSSWLGYALLPAVLSLLLVPWLVYRWHAPEIVRTPEATGFAAAELKRMGPTSRSEWTLLVIFLAVCAGWIFLSSTFGKDSTTLVAMVGVAALLLTGILTWQDAVSERAAWDVFIWYGGLVELGTQLQKAGVTTLFAETVAQPFAGLSWTILFVATLLIYYYAHYGFASITAHVLSMFAPFMLVLIDSGAPPLLMALVFAYFSNLSACLTHYGTTPGPILFSTGYVDVGPWWKIGGALSLVHLGVWLSAGLAWWKLLGVW